MKNKVFLGGTCAESTWREELIPLLNIDYFNPVVEDWDEQAMVEEERQKWGECNVHLYVFTPEQYGFYSFVELMDSLYHRDTIFAFYGDFNEAKTRSFNAIGQKVKEWKGIWIGDNDDGSISSMNVLAEFLNESVCSSLV